MPDSISCHGSVNPKGHIETSLSLMFFFIPVEGNPAFAVPDICIADVVEENSYLQQKRYTIINCIVNYLLDIRF